jgi:hypothetical protein
VSDPNIARCLDDLTLRFATVFCQEGSLTSALKRLETEHVVITKAVALKRLEWLEELFDGLSMSHTTQRKVTVPTDAMRDVAAAAARVLAGRRDQEHVRVREALQLRCSLDKTVVNVGGYQAHVERFLGRAVQLAHETFPWIPVELRLFDSGPRERGGGPLQEAFNSGEVDFMLRPSPMDASELDASCAELPCYRYRLRVVGSPEHLARLRGPANSLDSASLDGQTLAAAPAGRPSRKLLDRLLAEARAKPTVILEQETPLHLRVTGLAGKALAVLSDEYSVIGLRQAEFPVLHHRGREYAVEMSLIYRKAAATRTHEAFLWAAKTLAARERGASGTRPAALDEGAAQTLGHYGA